MTSAQDRQYLLGLARKAIKESLSGRSPVTTNLLPDGKDPPEGSGGAFVTLKKFGELRGCIGLLQSQQPIYDTIVEMARSAAFHDPRFPALKADELDAIRIEISRLSSFFPIREEEVELGKHGLFLRWHGRSGLFLPQVPVEQGWNLEQYLSGLCRKAGVPDGSWKHPDAQLEGFTAEVFGESESDRAAD